MRLLNYFLNKYSNLIANTIVGLFFSLPIIGVIYFFINIQVSVVLISIFIGIIFYLKKTNTLCFSKRDWQRFILVSTSLSLLFAVIISIFIDTQYTLLFLFLSGFAYLQVYYIPNRDPIVEKFIENCKHDPIFNHQLIPEDIIKIVEGIDTSIEKTAKDRFDLNKANISTDRWIDNNTNLEWQVNVPNHLMTWFEAIEYADELNRQNYLGIDTWRVPTVEELFTIHRDKPYYNNSYKDELDVYTHIVFPLLISMKNETQNYWSSEEFEHNNLENGINFASYVEFGSIGGNNFRKDYRCCVRCVSDAVVKRPTKILKLDKE